MVRSRSRSAGKKPAVILPPRWPPISRPSFVRRCISERRRGSDSAAFTEEYADFLESHIEDWTVNERRVAAARRSSSYYMRILPEQSGRCRIRRKIRKQRTLHIKNHSPGQQCDFPARRMWSMAAFWNWCAMVSAAPKDPIILATHKSDRCSPQDRYTSGVLPGIATITTAMDSRPRWRALHQRRNGPRLAAAHRRARTLRTCRRSIALRSYIRRWRARLSTGLLPEQIWDEADKPEIFGCWASPLAPPCR